MYIINCIVLYFLLIHDHNTIIHIYVHKDVGVVKFWSIKYMYIQIKY